ncbi:hypothetical protein KKI23_01125 [Patescibacteria group bacterium]|nr:hypothetical protein [Patescibacteria group bacterium]
MRRSIFIVSLIVVVALAIPALATDLEAREDKVFERYYAIEGEVEMFNQSVRPGDLWAEVALMNPLANGGQGGKSFLPVKDSEVVIYTKYAVVHEGPWDERAISLLVGRHVSFIGMLREIGRGEGSRTELIWGEFYIHLDNDN